MTQLRELTLKYAVANQHDIASEARSMAYKHGLEDADRAWREKITERLSVIRGLVEKDAPLTDAYCVHLAIDAALSELLVVQPLEYDGNKP